MKNIDRLSEALADFARERDWEQFHSPKNLAMALTVEAGELLEHFQWMSEQDSRQPGDQRIAAIAEEIADVQIYLLMLANSLGIDVLEAAELKIEKNRAKYPAETIRGHAEGARSRDSGLGKHS